MGGFNRKKNAVSIEELQSQIHEVVEQEQELVEQKPILWDSVPIISTGSTLLDLAISGNRIWEGGIPSCILAEVHGPSGSGKTSILSEIAGNAQLIGGDVQIQDPEARMDKEYARIYDVEIDKTNYHRPNTVKEVFDLVNKWQNDDDKLRVLLTDSLAALTTDFELDTGDKMGMRRAKEFSQGFRVQARKMANMLWVASNQERDNDQGGKSPTGGNAIGFYASLRIRVFQKRKIEIEKNFISRKAAEIATTAGKKAVPVKIKQSIGIESTCFVTKSTVDDAYRSAPIYIIFGYGIDDVRGNLQYMKDMMAQSTYLCPDGKKFMGMDQAIQHIEKENLKKELRAQTIELWHEVQDLFSSNRKRKKERG